MKWDPDRGAAELVEWTGIEAPVYFVRQRHDIAFLSFFGLEPRKGDPTKVIVCTISVLTAHGTQVFYGRTFHAAFLVARKALRPKRRYQRPSSASK